jgi:pyruvate dehydrogenase E2 component (dihydrolipoamide acetyltransferase)
MDQKVLSQPNQVSIDDEIKRVPLTPMRKTIASRMVESLQTMAQMTTSAEMDVTDFLNFHARLVEKEAELGVRISITDLMCMTVIKTLMQNPYANATMTDKEILLYPYIHLNLAISLPKGLVSPVIHHTEKMSLAELSLAIKEITERARGNKLTMDDFTAGTFTVSNIGAGGSGGPATPIINPPQAGIVQFGPAIKKPAVVDDAICIRSLMTVNCTFDHRIMDGMAVRDFIRCVKSYIGNPGTIH